MRTPAEYSCYVDAHAKVNLVLEVLGRRPDGYHALRGILVPLAVRDRVELFYEAKGEGAEVDIVPRGVSLTEMCPPEDNLVVRAFRAMARRFELAGGVRFRIVKRIPLGGGLGGGSADAAAALLGLNRMFALGLDGAELSEIGAELGCDVPALLCGGAVSISGRGEKVTPLFGHDPPPRRGFDVVVANPGVHVSTAKIYELCEGRLTNGADSYFNMRLAVKQSDPRSAAKTLWNGLQPVVLEYSPETRQAFSALERAGAPGVLVAGSGSSVFGLVRDRAQGEEVRARLPSGWWSVVTNTLPDGVMVAHGPLEP